MLTITIPESEEWNTVIEEFVYTKPQKIQLEHSLVSLSKWESKWCKPFLTKTQKTPEETIDYIRCMTITQNVKQETYSRLTKENMSEINAYISAPMTATWFSNSNTGGKTGEQITSELIYYWMIALNIPPEYQKWHLNRLFTLIKVCNEKNQPKKKMSQKEILKRNDEINEARKKQFNSNG